MIGDWILLDHAVYIPSIDSIIVSDLHLGKTHSSETIKTRLIEMIETTNCSKILFNGDIFNHYPPDKHDLELFNEIDERVSELVFINGNHEDNVGGYPLDIQQNYTVVDEYTVQNDTSILVHHGHKQKNADEFDVEIIGHLHLHENNTPVYLWNQSRNPSRLILPAFNKNLDVFNIAQITDQNRAAILKDEEIRAYEKIYV